MGDKRVISLAYQTAVHLQRHREAEDQRSAEDDAYLRLLGRMEQGLEGEETPPPQPQCVQRNRVGGAFAAAAAATTPPGVTAENATTDKTVTYSSASDTEQGSDSEDEDDHSQPLKSNFVGGDFDAKVINPGVFDKTHRALLFIGVVSLLSLVAQWSITWMLAQDGAAAMETMDHVNAIIADARLLMDGVVKEKVVPMTEDAKALWDQELLPQTKDSLTEIKRSMAIIKEMNDGLESTHMAHDIVSISKALSEVAEILKPLSQQQQQQTESGSGG